MISCFVLWEELMKKFVAIVASVIALFILGVVGYLAWNALTPPDDEPAYQDEIEYLNNDVDLEVMLYGEDIVFPQNFKYKKVDSIGEDVISVDSDVVYLIINDFKGELSISKDQMVFLTEYAKRHPNFNFYYLGTDKLDMINDIFPDCIFNDQDMSFGYATVEGDKLYILGIWSKYDEEHKTDDYPNMLGENIVFGIHQEVVSNE